MRRLLLWIAIIVATAVLALLVVTTAFWISVGGTIFRGEQVGAGTVFQIGLLVLACVGLCYLIRVMVRSARRT